MTRVVGYTRELFAGAGIAADVEQLEATGAEPVFVALASVDVRKRPGLAECLRVLEAGALLVFTSSARLSHRVAHFVFTTTALSERGVLFITLASSSLSADTWKLLF